MPEKKATEKMGFADEPTVKSWLIVNDKKLYADGLTLVQARARFKRETDSKVSVDRLSTMRQAHCQYWGKEKRVAFSRISDLLESDWDAIRRWAGKNMHILATAPSLEFVCRLMRLEDIPASPQILINSLSFMAKWREAKEL